MKNSQPISKECVSNWKSAKKVASSLESEIADRITYILEVLLKTFDQELECWYIDGAGEGEFGNLLAYMDSNQIGGIVFETKSKKKPIIFIDKFNKKYEFIDAIPTRWLHEEFETEIQNGKL